MKKTVVFMLAFLASTAVMAEGQVFVRTVDDMLQPSTCLPPTTREDGTTLNASEINFLDMYVIQDPAGPDGAPISSGLVCSGTVDMTILADGQHYLFWKTVDTEARTSPRSMIVPFVLQSNTGSVPSAPSLVTLGVSP